jgi:predicted TIM-barrel fold metal-dependent hydrolase
MRSPGFRFFMWRSGLSKYRDPVEREERYVEILRENLDGSELDRAVLLAMDRVYGIGGKVDKKGTHFFVSNDYVGSICKSFPDQFLYGASVHPYRRDALEELERVAEDGAVLIKLIPNSQGFDPAHPSLTKYYQKLENLGLPLLLHGGTEHTIVTIDQSLGNPARFENALASGATLIVAHMGSAGLAHMARETMGETLKLMAKYPHCYGDTGAFSTAWRGRYLLEMLDSEKLEEKYKISLENPTGRLIHGSDYPIPVTPDAFLLKIKGADRKRVRNLPSALQKDVETKRLLGMPDNCLVRANRELGIGL